MPIRAFRCADGQFISVDACLKNGGCRMANRCATRPYLRMISEEREWMGLTPSRAGNGPRKILLELTKDYAIDPDARVWAALGTTTHWRLSIHRYTYDVFSEEKLSDEKMQGISDVLEEDEDRPGWYILSDYKTWGSYKIAKAMGIIKVPEKIIDEKTGKQAVFKSGRRKGQGKTRQKIVVDPEKIDMRAEELQLNRYRIFFEKSEFPISHMNIQALARDGHTAHAYSYGLMKRLHVIPVRRLPDKQVLDFYAKLEHEVNQALETGYARRCNQFESWEGRRCKPDMCEVFNHCREMGD